MKSKPLKKTTKSTCFGVERGGSDSPFVRQEKRKGEESEDAWLHQQASVKRNTETESPSQDTTTTLLVHSLNSMSDGITENIITASL